MPISSMTGFARASGERQGLFWQWEIKSVNGKALEASPGTKVEPKYQEAQRRMAPQLFGHVLMVALIVAGNVIFFAGRRKEARA